MFEIFKNFTKLKFETFSWKTLAKLVEMKKTSILETSFVM